MTKITNHWRIGLLVFASLLICACGYRFPGGGEIPGGIRAVSIPLFDNLTNEIGLENILTNDLTNEFLIRRKKSLAKDDTTADGRLLGNIVSILTRTITQTEAGGSIEREVVVVVDVKLIDQKEQVVWTTRGITSRENYDVGADSTVAEVNRQEAIRELSVRLSEKIYNRLMDDF